MGLFTKCSESDRPRRRGSYPTSIYRWIHCEVKFRNAGTGSASDTEFDIVRQFHMPPDPEHPKDWGASKEQFAQFYATTERDMKQLLAEEKKKITPQGWFELDGGHLLNASNIAYMNMKLIPFIPFETDVPTAILEGEYDE